ncbi:MAG: hypothetical protein ACI4WX_02980 [Aristaeellaceae bacterium]
MSTKPTKAYVQFSKRMVVMVMVSVTVIVAISVIGMIYDSAYDQLPEVMENYLRFASVVFVAYSGNSAVEKWLVSTAKVKAQRDSLEYAAQEEDYNSVG